jgi:hypothetical protein
LWIYHGKANYPHKTLVLQYTSVGQLLKKNEQTLVVTLVGGFFTIHNHESQKNQLIGFDI